MLLEKIISRRLIFVTGKGGVGKSTLSAAIANLAASTGKHTAIIELCPEYTLDKFFSVPFTNQNIIEISPHISLLRLRTNLVLEEFVTEKFHSRGVYKVLFDNRLVSYFLDATPGFREFLIMGKIRNLVEQNRIPYDIVIVDAPATGHAIALLEVPKIVSNAVHSGPLKDLAENTLDLICDRNETGVAIVSLAEEMPTTEAIMLKAKMEELGLEPLGILANKIERAIHLDEGGKAGKYLPVINNALKINNAIVRNQGTHIKTLKKTFGDMMLEIPFVRELDEAGITESISKIISEVYGPKK